MPQNEPFAKARADEHIDMLESFADISSPFSSDPLGIYSTTILKTTLIYAYKAIRPILKHKLT